MLTPQEAGDAALGQLTLGLVFIADHFIPAVHKFLSWETDDVDLGPIVPVSPLASCFLTIDVIDSLTFVIWSLSTGMVRIGQLHQLQLWVQND